MCPKGHNPGKAAAKLSHFLLFTEMLTHDTRHMTHNTQYNTQVCPKGLNPGKAIAKLKQSLHKGSPV